MDAGIKPMLFLGFFAFCLVMSLKSPRYAIIGYMGVYLVGPENVWWGKAIAHYGIRYSFFMGAALAFSLFILHWKNRKIAGPFWLPIEKYLIAYLIWGILSYNLFGPKNADAYQGLDKAVKLTVFLIMLSHFATTLKEFRVVMWVIIAGGILFGFRAFTAPASAFSSGRLDTLGGPDFVGSNPFALQLSVSLVLLGVMFLQVNKPLVKAGLLFCGAFILNAIIMARGRGAFLGLFVGTLVAMTRAPARARKAVYVAMVLGVIGMFVLGDEKYWDRITAVQSVEEAETDESANSRLETWKAAMKMFADHPMGVGRGKFKLYIGQYNPAYAKRDAHNTYVRCLCEMGVIGLFLFLTIFYKCFRALVRIRKYSHEGEWGRELALYAFGVLVTMTIYLSGGFFSTVMNIEGLWWLVGMTVCMQRVALNYEAEKEASLIPAKGAKSSPAIRGAARPPRRVHA